jgi:ribosomal protein S18 acetylase RimI-like enzyme
VASDLVPRVAVLFPEQFEQTAVALGRAFINDPPLKAILPDVTEPVERARRLAEVFRVVLAIQRRQGEPVLGVLEGGKVVAAAVIEGAHGAPPARIALVGLGQLPRMIRAVNWAGTARGVSLMDTLARNHPAEPHIYLNFLGVDPDYQRRHCGQALLQYLRMLAVERTDVTGVYLETATEPNVAYYSAKGYEVIGEIFPLGVRMWRMFQRKR